MVFLCQQLQTLELLGQVEPKQIKNTYVYEKKGDSWQLTDFRPSI